MKWWSNATVSGSGNAGPEKRLLAAVLQRAVADFVGGEEEIRQEAGLWILDDEPTDAPLTFRFICEALDLDWRSLRKAIVYQAANGGATVTSAALAAMPKQAAM